MNHKWTNRKSSPATMACWHRVAIVWSRREAPGGARYMFGMCVACDFYRDSLWLSWFIDVFWRKPQTELSKTKAHAAQARQVPHQEPPWLVQASCCPNLGILGFFEKSICQKISMSSMRGDELTIAISVDTFMDHALTVRPDDSGSPRLQTSDE